MGVCDDDGMIDHCDQMTEITIPTYVENVGHIASASTRITSIFVMGDHIPEGLASLPYVNNSGQFIISCDNLSMYMDLNDGLIVTPYCIRFSHINTTYPIFKSIQLASRNKYDVDENLIIGSIVDDIPERMFKTLKVPNPFLNQKVLQRLLMQDWNKRYLLESTADGNVRYIARENEFELSEGLGKLI